MNIITDPINSIAALLTLTNIKKNRVLKSDNTFTIVAKIGDFIIFMFYTSDIDYLRDIYIRWSEHNKKSIVIFNVII